MNAKKKTKKALPQWRVVYGETMPSWEKTFPTYREAEDFALEHEGFGDVIFSVARVIPGEPPQSITAALAAQQ